MFKDFSNEALVYDLKSTLSSFSQIAFGTFKSIVDNILQYHAPIKKRYVGANQALFIKIHKEIMRKPFLRNKFKNSKTYTNRIAYNKQCNYCASLTQKSKKTYFNNLQILDVTDNKTFWRKGKPLFPEKVNLQAIITLVEKGNVLNDHKIFF